MPVITKDKSVKGDVNVYHFIVSNTNKKIADTTEINQLKRESKKAYDWITSEATKSSHIIAFKEHWPVNIDTNFKSTFIYKLPSNSLQVLIRKNQFRIVTRKKTKTQYQIKELVNWKESLVDSLVAQLADTSVIRNIKRTNDKAIISNNLFVFHLLKVKKSSILGFYSRGKIFLGKNKSSVIAHESIHHLGASDLYIHKYWFGRRRRKVKQDLRLEVMNSSLEKTFDCEKYYLSNYTKYTIGWDDNIDNEYKLILKQNSMANLIFHLSLFL